MVLARIGRARDDEHEIENLEPEHQATRKERQPFAAQKHGKQQNARDHGEDELVQAHDVEATAPEQLQARNQQRSKHHARRCGDRGHIGGAAIQMAYRLPHEADHAHADDGARHVGCKHAHEFLREGFCLVRLGFAQT
ncbi:hypothetical protein AAY81_08375 [Denitrobacterium detoxificans]|nr:hypothetical protein AAY81_08375 [Denitrobacterium detoxificans]